MYRLSSAWRCGSSTCWLWQCVCLCVHLCVAVCVQLWRLGTDCVKNGLAFSQHMRPSPLVLDLAWLVLGSGRFRVVLTSIYSKWSVCVIEWPLLMMFMPRWEEMLHKQSWQRVFGSLSTFDWWLALNRLSPHYLLLCLFLPFSFCLFLSFNKMMVRFGKTVWDGQPERSPKVKPRCLKPLLLSQFRSTEVKTQITPK